MAGIMSRAQEYGIEPVPPAKREFGVWDNFVLWADLGISFLVMVVGMFLVPGLGFWEAMAAILVGAVIGNVLLGIGAVPGSETGVPTMVLLRAPLGLRGSYLPTVLNIVQLLGWAALEVIVMAQAANTLAKQVFDLPSAYHVWVLVFTALTLGLALAGPVLVTKRLLKTFVIWAVLLSTIWITIALLVEHDISSITSSKGDGSMTFWGGIDLVVALPVSWFPLVADYSRFAKNGRSAFWGTAAGYFVPHTWFYALGVLLVLAAGVTGDSNSPITPLLTAISGLTVGALALFVLLIDETDEGFANVYSTAVSIQNLVPRLSQKLLICIISAIVLVVAWAVPLVEYETFLLFIGAIFVPLLAVTAADYFVLRGRRYEVGELYRRSGAYWYNGGVNWLGIAAWAAGAATFMTLVGIHFTIFDWTVNVAGQKPELGGTLPSFVVAFVLHLVLGRVWERRSSAEVARA